MCGSLTLLAACISSWHKLLMKYMWVFHEPFKVTNKGGLMAKSKGRGGVGWGGVGLGGGQKEWCKYVYKQLEWQMEHHQHLKNKNTLHTCLVAIVLLPLLV